MSGPSDIARMAGEGLEELSRALEEPEEAQARVLERLLKIYARTGFGREHGLEPDMDLEGFRSHLLPGTYRDFEPYLRSVREGHVEALLAEEPIFFGITSGTTGPPKMVPITPTDARLRAELMATCLAWLASYWQLEGVFGSPCLAPCLPSQVRVVRVREREVPCGYISGINAEIMARYLGLGAFLRPYLDAMNEVGPSVSREAWGKRFQALLEALEGREVRLAVGAGPALWMLAEWLKRTRGKLPRELWDIRLLLVAGVPFIRDSYWPVLPRLYGPDAVFSELYGATEGLFAAWLADEPYLVPFYHAYLFEVKVKGRVKMLHEMRAGEVGSLIISTPVFPRYEIGDLVLCHADGLYFSVLGRDRLATRLRHWAARAISKLASLL